MANERFVSYLRVSTQRQGVSGLGLDAQREAVRQHLNSGSGTLVGEYVEVESGRKADRPQLVAALAACKLHRAVLVIARLDRLARNAVFLLDLQAAGVSFIAADLPQANRLTVGILAVVAEEEGRAISARTKAALAAAKARGVRLGTPANLSNTEAGRLRGNAARMAVADYRAREVMPTIEILRAGSDLSLRMIASELNDRGIPAARGGIWSANAVRRIIDRADAMV